MRFPKSLAACAIALATFAEATAVGAGPALAGVANPPAAPPLTFPTVQLDTEPSGVAVDPTTHMVYVANPQNDGNGLVSVIDAADDFSPPVLLEQLRVPGDPTAIGVDTSTHIVYAAGNNGLTMINAATIPPTVGSIIQLGGDQNLAGQVAVDSATHTVYVTEFGANDVKVVDTAVNPPTVTRSATPRSSIPPSGSRSTPRHIWLT
jgi:DNA-binding beta-propeller fold protein YncE